MVIKDTLTPLSIASKKLKASVIRSDGSFDNTSTEYLKAVQEVLLSNKKISNDIGNLIDDIDSKYKNAVIVNKMIIPFDSVKSYIYNKYDYLSVILFARNVFSKYKSNLYDTVYQIDEERENYLKRTFYTDFTTPEECIEDFHNQIEFVNLSEDEIDELIDVIKYKDNIVNPIDIENKKITEAVRVIIGLIRTSLPEKFTFEHQVEYKTNVSVIKNIIDSINFMLTIRTVKIDSICRYLEYIHGALSEQTPEVTESVIDTCDIIDEDDVTLDGNLVSTIFQNYNEADIKKIENIQSFYDKIYKFLNHIMSNKIPKEFDFKIPESNKMLNEIKKNKLIKFISDTKYRSCCGSTYEPTYEMIYHKLYNLIYDRRAFVDPVNNTVDSTAKNDLLAFIRDYKNSNNESNASLKESAYDMYIITRYILDTLQGYINFTRVNYKDTLNPNNSYQDGQDTNITAQSTCARIINLINELYNEFIVVFMYKFRDIENRLNDNALKERKKILGMFNIGDDFKLKRDIIPDSTFASILPYTMRVYENATDEFIMEDSFVALEYSSFVSEYLFEAETLDTNTAVTNKTTTVDSLNKPKIDIKPIIEKIKKFIETWFKKIQQFTFKYDKAVQWVNSVESKLTTHTFTDDDKISGVLIYNLESPNVVFSGYSKLQNINIQEASKDIERFEASLYSSEEIYKIFKDEKDASDIYLNMLMFKQKDPSPKYTISGSDLSKRLTNDWIKDIKQYQTYMKIVKDNTDKIINSLNSLRVKEFNESVLLEADTAPPDLNSNDSASTSTVEKPSTPRPQNSDVNIQAIISSINKVNTNILNAYFKAIQNVFINEYNYIKYVYNNFIATAGK